MILSIFDVEHGACALLETDDGKALMIDCGQNASTGWKPGTYLRSRGISAIDLLAITNYDEDHVRGLPDLLANVTVNALLRNKSVSAATIARLKTADGMGTGISTLASAIDGTFTAGSVVTSFAGVDYSVFYNDYPSFDDENNLSLVLFLQCNGRGILFPGDLERAGWLALLKNPGFTSVLAKTDVLVAPHHGRISGCCDEIRPLLGAGRPYYVVISDKGYMYETQDTLSYYRALASGGPFRGETRRVLTTRNDGLIRFELGAGAWYPF